MNPSQTGRYRMLGLIGIGHRGVNFPKEHIPLMDLI